MLTTNRKHVTGLNWFCFALYATGNIMTREFVFESLLSFGSDPG